MATTQTDDEIDLTALLAEIIAGWKLIITLLFIGLLLGTLYVKVTKPTYRSDALIQVDKKSSGLSALSGASDLLKIDASPAQTEIELLKSRMILSPVVKDLHLDIDLSQVPTAMMQTLPVIKKFVEQPPVAVNDEDGVGFDDIGVVIADFNVPKFYENETFTLMRKNAQQFSLLTVDGNELTGQIGELQTLNTSEGEIEILVKNLPENDKKYRLTKRSADVVARSLSNSLNVVEKGKQTGILSVSLQGGNQQQITKTLTRIVQSYETQNRERSSAETTKTLEFMEKQLPELKRKLHESEVVFNEFRQENATVDIDKEAQLMVTETVALRTNLRELELKKAELSQRYTDEYPLLQQVNAQIQEIIERENYLKNKIKQIPEIQRKFMELSSDAKINAEIYLSMLKNYEQLQVIKSGQIGYVRVIDLPISTNIPVAPKKAQIIALATLLGAFFGVGLVLLISLLKNTVKNPDELENATGVPVLANVPRTLKATRSKAKGKVLPLLEMLDVNSSSYESIKSLRTNIFFSLTGSLEKIIIITGASPNIGKSFISANLAVAMAKANKKVLLIDADMRLGHLHDYFHLPINEGLVDVLMGRHTSLHHVTQKTAIDNLGLITRGKKPRSPAELLISVNLTQMLTEVAHYYDYVILDAPPILAATDSVILTKYAQYTLFVARYGVSSVRQVAYAIKQLENAGGKIDGIIFNDTQQKVLDKYNYHYVYGYHDKKGE